MKGRIQKTDQGWVVEYAKHAELPLHPEDVKQINRDAQVFDNIEARIMAYPDIDFEIVEKSDISGRTKYAKIKK
jgi:hypothetical protein